MTGVLTFAFVAGSVATANPCGFALLPAFLARQLGADGDSTRGADAVARAVVVGALTTAGFLIVFGSFGAVITLGGRWLIQAVPWLALSIGIALVVAGIAVLAGRRVGLRLPLPVRRSAEGGHLSALTFGVADDVPATEVLDDWTRSSASGTRCTLPTSSAVRPPTACSCYRTRFSSTSR